MRSRPTKRLLGRLLGVGGGALLVGYHGVLFGQRVTDQSLSDPAVGLRWLAGALLVGWMAMLQRRGVRLFWGRRALFFWLVAALLHLPMLAPLGLAAGNPAAPWGSLLPAILGLGLVALAGLGRAPLAGLPAARSGRPRRRGIGGHGAPLPDPLFGRPPPPVVA